MIPSAGMRVGAVLLAYGLMSGVSARAADTQEALQTRLQKTVSLPKGIDENTRLRDALDHLAERWKLDITIDAKLFAKRGLQDIENQPVGLPRLVNIRLATLLDLVAIQVNGSCMLLKEQIVVMPRSLSSGAKGMGYRPLPIVAVRASTDQQRGILSKKVSLDKKGSARLPLAEALQLLAEHCEVNIVIDPSASLKSNAKDTGRHTIELVAADGAQLAEVLDSICSQAKATYRLQENIIWVVPPKS